MQNSTDEVCEKKGLYFEFWSMMANNMALNVNTMTWTNISSCHHDSQSVKFLIKWQLSVYNANNNI